MIPITKQEYSEIKKRTSSKKESPMTGRNKNGRRKKHYVLEGDNQSMKILAEIRGTTVKEILKQHNKTIY